MRNTDIGPSQAISSGDDRDRGRRKSTSTIIIELYNARKEAAPPMRKRPAAQALANYHSRSSSTIEADLLGLRWIVGSFSPASPRW